jgi:hypothetical protein
MKPSGVEHESAFTKASQDDSPEDAHSQETAIDARPSEVESKAVPSRDGLQGVSKQSSRSALADMWGALRRGRALK